MAKDENQKKQEVDAHNELVRRRMHGLDERTGRPIEKSSGGGGTNCFPRGTLVATPDGLRDISSLKEGEQVIAFDPESGMARARRILKKRCHKRACLWTLQFSEGAALRTTSAHCFWVDGRWTKASNLRAGATVTSVEDGTLQSRVIVRSEASDDREPVFNLIVKGEFTFTADGVLAHSFSYFRGPRMLIWRLIEAVRQISPEEQQEGWHHVAG